MGFGEKWCKWVDTCLMTAKVSVLVNGSPTQEFNMERGVKQGDLLSPFLFLIVADGFNVMIKEAIRIGVFKGINVGQEEVELSHLQYADDTIIFGEWSMSNAKNLIRVMKNFLTCCGFKN